MSFEEFVDEIQNLAVVCGAYDASQIYINPFAENLTKYEYYCDPEAWRDMFNEGMTPAEAWSEEVDAAGQMLG